MKNILILATGAIAKNFISLISKNRVTENNYFVTCHKAGTTSIKFDKNIILINIDPTSFSKLNNLLISTSFDEIFIIMEDREEVEYVLKNIIMINKKIHITLVNQWNNTIFWEDCENINILNRDDLIATHLYDQLPNVPLIAQNIGLGRGEIMEIHIPFGSSYSYRHIGSILQRKWKIVAIYRDNKQILATNSMMIRPNDTLLTIGKPLILDGIYKTINNKIGLFPEPFGKDIYIILDFRFDKEKILSYIKESLYLIDKLEREALIIRVIYPNDFTLLDELRELELNHNIILCISYIEEDIKRTIEYDIQHYNIGLILSSINAFKSDNLREMLYNLKKLVYIFGDIKFKEIKKCIVLMDLKEKMESISSTAFDITQTFNFELTLADFDPDGDFESKTMIIEHYETLTQIFNIKMTLEQKISNPIRELASMHNILQIAPFEKLLNTSVYKKFFSTKIEDFLLTTNRHPILLVPVTLNEV